jgi:hypothetical protein
MRFPFLLPGCLLFSVPASSARSPARPMRRCPARSAATAPTWRLLRRQGMAPGLHRFHAALLIERALANNPDLVAATYRIEQARARANSAPLRLVPPTRRQRRRGSELRIAKTPARSLPAATAARNPMISPGCSVGKSTSGAASAAATRPPAPGCWKPNTSATRCKPA